MIKKPNFLVIGLFFALAFLLAPMEAQAQQRKKTELKNTGKLELWSKETQYTNSSGRSSTSKSLMVGYEGGNKKDLKSAYKFDFKSVYKSCPSALKSYNESMDEYRRAKKFNRFALLGGLGAALVGTAAGLKYKKDNGGVNMTYVGIGMGVGAAVYMGFAFPMSKHNKKSIELMGSSVEDYNRKCVQPLQK